MIFHSQLTIHNSQLTTHAFHLVAELRCTERVNEVER